MDYELGRISVSLFGSGCRIKSGIFTGQSDLDGTAFHLAVTVWPNMQRIWEVLKYLIYPGSGKAHLKWNAGITETNALCFVYSFDSITCNNVVLCLVLSLSKRVLINRSRNERPVFLCFCPMFMSQRRYQHHWPCLTDLQKGCKDSFWWQVIRRSTTTFVYFMYLVPQKCHLSGPLP